MHREKILSRSCANLRNPFSLMARKRATTKISYQWNLTRSVGLKSCVSFIGTVLRISKTKVNELRTAGIHFDIAETTVLKLFKINTCKQK